MTSIAAAISIALRMVPIPGLSLKGIHSNSTKTLTRKVAWPTDQSMFTAIPSASTVQGVFPMPAAMRMASPVPKTQRPKTRISRVLRGGLMVIGSVALHQVVGTSLAGRSKESTPMAHDGTSALNPIGVARGAESLPQQDLGCESNRCIV